ncbi:hypothetical protein INT48_004771 [Thamnidium elegans]|uniref:Uncharacterized protein n=1 Tax=Thamnidium elegans TaxID=101142 RepID=A0A8H7SKE6_9FUNG|nr:hypothetical protein INT48_004771 [Thamnidium elegans]
MCARVFDPQVKKTLDLIDNQIKKANSTKIDALFLLGGFGESKYLQAQTKKRFKDIVGEVITDGSGNLAAMQGAIYYGLKETKRPREISIIPNTGYEYSTCGYFDLDIKDQIYSQMKLISLTGIHKGKGYKIPTLLEYSEEYPDQVSKRGVDVNPYNSSRVTPSHTMFLSKDDSRTFMTDYLKHLYKYAIDSIKQDRGKATGKNRIRYCITMENIFHFFRNKKEMMNIANDADLHMVKHADVDGFTSKRADIDNLNIAQQIEDSVQVPCSFDDKHFEIVIDDLIERIPKDGFRLNSTSCNQHIDKIFITGKFVLPRDAIEEKMLTYLIKNLLPFVTEEENIVHVDKEAQSFEDRNTKYDQELPIESKHTAKDDNICHFLQINVQRDCYHLNLYKTAKLHDQGKIEYHNVRKLKSTTFEFDAIGKMMKRLRQYTHDEQQKYHCISSELHRLDTKIYENDLRYGLKNYVKFSDCNGDEVISGAAMYGLDPELHTERVSRRTYAVSVQARPVRTDQLPLILTDTEKHVDIHFQSKKGSHETIKVKPETKIRLINQNDPVTMSLQSVSTFERFFLQTKSV